MLFFYFHTNAQVHENNYLNEVKKTLTEEIYGLKSLNPKQKSVCLKKVFETLKTDERIINENPYFDIGFSVKNNNNTKEVEYTYNFGTHASLTSKSIFIDEDKEIIVNYNFLKNYPKNYSTIYDINNKENKIARKILIDKILKLIGKKYFNFMINSSFQKQNIENDFYIEEHTKIYDSWETSVLIIFDIKSKILYSCVIDDNEIFKYSESGEYPYGILNIINNWKPLE